ncbi:anti-sigma factor domain-containing protein [Rossellomorea vietnamensis]|uniref:anti-sigma factor domain-containing protein n=1 Tax=Rossellomorea vietnamensis TaxID=218284 RepID=UPI001E3FC75D|nr:anti-sigma factor domain-containing protein [Rossellomorea vietnamensis]MCC5804609.1 anti-sigma factor domain-containing protein [Rossellomorea vietnamensis]
MKKGIIMEIKQDILVMMTPEGEFLTGRKQPDQQYAIGEEIPFFPLSSRADKPNMISKWNWRVSTSLLTVLVVIIALFSSSVLQNNRAYAYVSVDINPSMELTLNKDQQVLDIKPYNGDAEVLLKELRDWKNEDVGEVTKKIFLLSERLGYLKGIQNVFITSSFIDDSDPKRETELMDELNEFVEDYGSDHSTNIIMKETSREFRKKASEKGMTAGSLIRETEQKDSTPTTEPVKNDSKKEDNEVQEKMIKQEKEKQKKAIIDEKIKAENQKVNPPVKEKNQPGDKAQKPQKNHDQRQKPHPEKSGERGKSEKSQMEKSSNGNNGNRGNDKPNRGHDHSTRNDQGYHENNVKRNDHQNKRNEEKKQNHENRKENKKD